MNDPHEQEIGIVTSVGTLGKDHEASFQRSYWNHPHMYTRANQFEEDWHDFQAESQNRGRRRAMMRTLVTPELLTQAAVPFEAAIPYEDVYLAYLGKNSHQPVSLVQNVVLPTANDHETRLVSGYQLDDVATNRDIPQLAELWAQFGWTSQGVETFVEIGNVPLVLIRDLEQQVVAVMIAESLEFGELLLVELTEMAVAPSERGKGLATILIRELSQLSLERFGPAALLYGEYNLTTKAHWSATRAGNLPAQCGPITGVLVDHVSIETGPGNDQDESWDTQWLHNFLVMYHPLHR